MQKKNKVELRIKVQLRKYSSPSLCWQLQNDKISPDEITAGCAMTYRESRQMTASIDIRVKSVAYSIITSKYML